jgi:formate-dependent nitrite reductase cytochrome c552 subunit
MMRNLLSVCLSSLAFVLLMGLVGCEGDIGPQGTIGPQGPLGPPGAAGQDGQNGAENCIQCHGNNQLITAKMFQWENSVHYLGGHYERNQASCAACHTSQGFLDRIATGAMAASADVQDPLPQNCYTCHQIHQKYDSQDWALTASDPVTMWVGGETVDVGKGNLCVNCHQPRVPSPALPATSGATGTLTITSTRYGPHHGAQGALFNGVGAWEVGSGYANSSHTSLISDACVSCHMAETTGGRAAGGHTFRVETESGSLNFNACKQCHTDQAALANLVESTQEGIETLMTQLGDKLIAAGLLSSSNRESSRPGTYTPAQVGALYNYKYILEDQSMGVHNANYARVLLENSIAALD